MKNLPNHSDASSEESGNDTGIIAEKGAANYLSLLRSEGGCVSAEEAAQLYKTKGKTTSRDVSEAVRAGRLIGDTDSNQVLHIPVWQFDADGNVLRGIVEVINVLKALPYFSGMTVMIFMLNLRCYLDGKCPLDALHEGDPESVERVLTLARDELR